jgi:hypothetical protein
MFPAVDPTVVRSKVFCSRTRLYALCVYDLKLISWPWRVQLQPQRIGRNDILCAGGYKINIIKTCTAQSCFLPSFWFFDFSIYNVINKTHNSSLALNLWYEFNWTKNSNSKPKSALYFSKRLIVRKERNLYVLKLLFTVIILKLKE